VNTCPYHKICVTPNWYWYSTHGSFVREVCLTTHYKDCVSYQSFEDDDSDRIRTEKYIKNHELYIECPWFDAIKQNKIDKQMTDIFNDKGLKDTYFKRVILFVLKSHKLLYRAQIKFLCRNRGVSYGDSMDKALRQLIKADIIIDYWGEGRKHFFKINPNILNKIPDDLQDNEVLKRRKELVELIFNNHPKYKKLKFINSIIEYDKLRLSLITGSASTCIVFNKQNNKCKIFIPKYLQQFLKEKRIILTGRDKLIIAKLAWMLNKDTYSLVRYN